MNKENELFDNYETSVYPEVHVGQRVLINDKAPYFNGALASVAYIGSDGISVYLIDSEIDECISLSLGEWSEIDSEVG